jgi:CRISPR system Cascade subunit CasB
MESRELGKIVDSRVTRLQAEYLGQTRNGASAKMAALRHAVGREPGEVPEIWDITIAGLPPSRGNEPSPEENAAHDSLVLYALHQQSRSLPMHRRGLSLGKSIRVLAGSDEQPAVRRRFHAAVTAQTYAELRYHLRGLVSQLRGAEIATDYGGLAADLLDAQRPGGMTRVRRRWARAYSGGIRAPDDGSASEVRVDEELEVEEKE